MKHFALIVLLLLSACAPLRHVKTAFRLSNPDPACERQELCRRYGWCGEGARLVTVGDELWGFKDVRLGSKSETINFGFETNPFNCQNRK